MRPPKIDTRTEERLSDRTEKGILIPARGTSASCPCSICNPSIILSKRTPRSEEHTSELQSLMRISYAVFCLKKKIKNNKTKTQVNTHQKYNIIAVKILATNTHT